MVFFCMIMSVIEENKKISVFVYILFIVYFFDEYIGNIQVDEIFLLYKEKLFLLYNVYYKFF